MSNKRPAHVTPSQMKTLMPKNGLGKGAETYADEIVMRFIGVEMDDYTSHYMERGNKLEPDARDEYMRQTLREVQDKKRIVHPDYSYISGEPDGLVGDKGGIEIKCPKEKHHLRNYLHGEQIKKYYAQMQGYMFITDRAWWDFVSYDPRFPAPLHISIRRVERDSEFIETLENRCVEFWNDYVEPRKQKVLEEI